MANNTSSGVRNDTTVMDCNVIELPERSCCKPIDLLVGNRLARLRGLYGITIGILGAALDISPHLIKDYESGCVRAPPHVLSKLAAFFSVPLADLLAGTYQNLPRRTECHDNQALTRIIIAQRAETRASASRDDSAARPSG
jgi:transcriptional regulator with XRE-family HTH domain